MIDRSKVHNVQSRINLDNLRSKNEKVNAAKEKLEELIKFKDMLKNNYRSFANHSENLLMILSGKYARIKTLSQELEDLSDELKYMPGKDA